VRTLLDKVRTRGHWIVRIHPTLYRPDRVARLEDLEQAVRDSAVALRGWDFPHYDLGEPRKRSAGYVEQSVDWEYCVEFWRAYKSGQFVSIAGLLEDWRDQSTIWPPSQDWRSGATLGIQETIFRIVEIYEFAARWSRSLEIEDSLVVACTLRGLQNRTLKAGPGRRPFFGAQTCSASEWSHSLTYSPAELLAQARELAIPPAVALFEVFGWNVSPDAIREVQRELRG